MYSQIKLHPDDPVETMLLTPFAHLLETRQFAKPTIVGIIANFAPEEDILSVYDTFEFIPAATVEEDEVQVARGHEREHGAVWASCEDLRMLRVKCDPLPGGHVLGRAAMVEESPCRNASANDRMA